MVSCHLRICQNSCARCFSSFGVLTTGSVHMVFHVVRSCTAEAEVPGFLVSGSPGVAPFHVCLVIAAVATELDVCVKSICVETVIISHFVELLGK